ncbi:XdhC Rossmann domain-containing protein [Actinokineospora alba]|uniref:XdhC Rossmann domain-containing protein n=1 Tax=Actinokineospora alba TaxID=504798 RepID=A0A1H0UX12_9PSEU|nr:XdhC family protein [Actinokineospora alba]SDI77441.1 XdhC Rossmann domain-containing protein [Actinokineospora alba]SDP70641.1 XdhC Rossmann domain-containing protein [Actinokineospora alba]
MTSPDSCDIAHGAVVPDTGTRTLVAVFATKVAEHLLRYGADLGYRVVLVDPEDSTGALSEVPADLGPDADVIVTDHHRAELGEVLRDVLAANPRWVGVMGNPRHPAPHVPALRDLGVDEERIAAVHRPIGLNIGSRTPAEIAIATLAGLIADRNGKPGGFEF